VTIGLITPQMASGERGGAEALYRGLLDGLRDASHEAVEIPVRADESSFEAVLETYARCSALDLHEYDLVISTKAPTFMVCHPNHVVYLLHTLRVFYDMFESEYGVGTAYQQAQRRTVHALDKFGLRPGRVRRHYAIGHTPYRRLFEASPWWQQVGFQALHCPPALAGFRRPGGQDHILVPGRLHRWKRVGLVIEAFKHVKRNVPLIITGTGEDERALRALAGDDKRIRFLGGVSDDTLLDLYANALAVPFLPRQEDLGFITIEAFKSRKPVLTCTDSGEPLEFVRDGHTGYVVAPEPKAIAARLTHLIDNRPLAARMGQNGFRSVSHIAWEPIVRALVGESRPSVAVANKTTTRRSRSNAQLDVAVLDMQPIHPAVGGGRLRLLGLYHALGTDMPTTYVGTYDWPGEQYRRHRLSETLEEIDVPLGEQHFTSAAEWQALAGGHTVIDSAFPHLAHRSPAYVEQARRRAAAADVVVFSHPWIHPLVKDVLRRRRQLIVYDAHNVEGLLRLRLLGDTPFGHEVATRVALLERELCQAADLVLACSHEDRVLFNELYDVPFQKCAVVANGTFTEAVTPAGPDRRNDAKRALGLPSAPVASFLGSLYGPNEEAARFILDTLAPALPGVTFAICGGVGAAFDASAVPSNVRLTLQLDEADKRRYLEATDVAINPMFSGSGTNIKMFDFMAAGLPIVTTAIGARGIRTGADSAYIAASRDDFARQLRRVVHDPGLASRTAAEGRRVVRESYSWERLSPALGRLLRRHHQGLRQSRPSVSVVIATYERHHAMDALVESLSRQTLRNFEVIVVDQSSVPWAPATTPPFELMTVQTDIKGAVHARNLGAFYARGDVLAFTDDDCRPDADWLEAGLRHFQRSDVVGVEGLIVSDRVDDPGYRPVTNVGFEGIGFMTANLLLRRKIFLAIDGFDAQFDHPHFREDTDLGWRALACGNIPFASDVRVYHPPQRRAVSREGVAERLAFFEKDALLLKKHPERYRTLFLREAHYAKTRGFTDHLRRGAAKYGVTLDEFYLARCARHD